jgi:cleavage and polyadenylation specificity factor subunit 1
VSQNDFVPLNSCSRLKENNDNTCLYIITLDLVARSYQVIVTIDHLPYDSLYIVPCPTSIGGVMVISTNALFHIDQSSKLSSLPLNGWAKRVTDLMFAGDDPLNDLHLEGSHAAFMNETEFVIVLASGKIYTVLLEHEGRLVQKLVLQQPVGIVSPPSMVITHENLLLVTSTSYQTVLLSRDAKDEALRAGHSTLGTRPNRG